MGTDNSKFGYAEGDECKRSGCKGIIALHPSEKSCYCHSCAPCSACTEPRGYCSACGWEESEDVVINDQVISVNKDTGAWISWEPRPLDTTKIDWHSHAYTHASMIKEGVYPEGATIEQVREKVKGTFGGRFEYFDNGKFKYIAYTD